MKKLRLLVTEKCNRSCLGCCNKDWDLKSLPICRDFSGYSEILITGGEPMLYGGERLKEALLRMYKEAPTTPVYVYTQHKDGLKLANLINNRAIEGITFTIHDKDAWHDFYYMEKALYRNVPYQLMSFTSLRLNIFKEAGPGRPVLNWKVKDNMEWIKNCPIPEDEVFMRL